MENATRALEMAASVMIGVLLVALLLFAYNRFVQVPQAQEQAKKTGQMAEFNKQYESYNQQQLKGTEVRSLFNMVLDNNYRNEGVEGYQIEAVVDGQNQRFYETLTDTQKNTMFNYRILYRCTGIEYNGTDGRISKITFEKIEN